ncbi:SH3 domain-containing protein [Glutamicibacter ardleyensis]|uniref:SH3 domain-containing protein n=1 Tax=Glutamicibacter ardleyensis TaxID=225894 RepID=UPI003FCF0E6B
MFNPTSPMPKKNFARAGVLFVAGAIILTGGTIPLTYANAAAASAHGSAKTANTRSTALASPIANNLSLNLVNWTKEAESPLKLRKSANNAASVLASIPENTALQVTESAGSWAKVVYKKQTGWVPAGSLRDISARKVNWSKETERSTPLRKAPDNSANTQYTIAAGQPVTVVASYVRWAKIKHQSSTGWVPAGWLRDRSAETSKPKPSPLPQPEAPKTETLPSDVLKTWGQPDLRDEFTHVDQSGKPAVDPSIWNVRGRDTLGLLPDKTVVAKDQVSVDQSGIAHLKADWLDKPVSAKTAPFERVMETGYMDMRSLREGDANYAQRYGRWEIRAKVPTKAGTSNGVLAAFWLRNENSGEIDIMESWGSSPTPPSYQKVGTSTTTVHTQTSGKNNQKQFWVLERELGITEHVANKFHTWALEYTPDRFAMYYDGKLAFETTPKESPDIWGPSFQSPLHVRLNLHMGMSEKYFGLPDPTKKQQTQNSDFQVDYVRVWDMKK